MKYSKYYDRYLQSLLQNLWGKTFETSVDLENASLWEGVLRQIRWQNWGDGTLQAEKRSNREYGEFTLCQFS